MNTALISIRGKDPSQEQFIAIRKFPQYLALTEQTYILYNLAEKQSKSGLFRNERLLILNSKSKSLCYISKLPQFKIPLVTQSQVESLVAKQTILRSEVDQNKGSIIICNFIEGKKGIQVGFKNKTKQMNWLFFFENIDLAREWHKHIITIMISQTNNVKQLNQKEKQQTQSKLISNFTPQPNHNQQPNEGNSIETNKFKHLHQINIPICESQFKNSIKHPLSLGFTTPKSSVMNTPHHPYHLNMQFETTYSQILQNAGKRSTSSTPKHLFINNETSLNYQAIQLRFMTQSNRLKTKNSEEAKQIQLNLNELDKNDENLSPAIKRQNTAQIDKNNNFDILFANLDRQKTITKKQSLAMKSELKVNETDWNAKYYQNQSNKVQVYCDFVKQGIIIFQGIVDQLPLTGSLFNMQKEHEYYIYTQNNINLWIAFDADDNEKDDQLTNDKPTIRNNIYQKLKIKFAHDKSCFFKNSKKLPQLIALYEYKGLLAYARAHNVKTMIKQLRTDQTKRTTEIQQQILLQAQFMKIHIISTQQLHLLQQSHSISNLSIDFLYKNTKVRHFKLLFINQIYSNIFVIILKSQLCFIYKYFPINQINHVSNQLITSIVADCVAVMINRLLGKGQFTDILWINIFQILERQYGIHSRKESVLFGYLINAICFKMGLVLRKDIKFSQKWHEFEQGNFIEAEDIIGFDLSIQSLQLQKMDKQLIEIMKQVQTTSMNTELMDKLCKINNKIPQYLNNFKQTTEQKICQFIPYSPDQKYQIYDIILTDQPTYHQFQISLQAIKWLLKKQQIEESQQLASSKIRQLQYWTGCCPLICSFHDIFINFYVERQQYQKAIGKIKLSINVLQQIFGDSNVFLLQKIIQISDILMTANKLDQSLQKLILCLKISKINAADLSLKIKIINKMCRINIVMQTYNQAIQNGLSALQTLSQISVNHNSCNQFQIIDQYLNVFELLLRALQLSGKRNRLFKIGTLCLSKCQHSPELKVFRRMLKLVIYPFLKQLKPNQSKYLLILVQYMTNTFECLNFTDQYLFQQFKLNKWHQQIKMCLPLYFQNIMGMFLKVEQSRVWKQFSRNIASLILMKQSLEQNNPISFLLFFFVIINLTGQCYFTSFLKHSYYQ